MAVQATERAARVQGPQLDESLRWLDWPEYLAMVQELRREVAGRDNVNRLRPRAEVAMSMQVGLEAPLPAERGVPSNHSLFHHACLTWSVAGVTGDMERRPG